MRRGLRHGRILRAAERPALPWKNGGGVTREVVAHPPGSDLGHFDWRVSIAEIHNAGPFSRFPGIERRNAPAACASFYLIEIWCSDARS